MRFIRRGLHDQFRDVMCSVEPEPSDSFQINKNNRLEALYKVELLWPSSYYASALCLVAWCRQHGAFIQQEISIDHIVAIYESNLFHQSFLILFIIVAAIAANCDCIMEEAGLVEPVDPQTQ